jgi:hypothetical protein
MAEDRLSAYFALFQQPVSFLHIHHASLFGIWGEWLDLACGIPEVWTLGPKFQFHYLICSLQQPSKAGINIAPEQGK